MAVDETLKYKIRARYESNNLSPKRLKEEHFPAEDVSHKTIESWVSKEGWEKNKYSSLELAFEKLLDFSIEEQLKEKGKELVQAEVVGEFPDSYKDEITAEMVRQAITAQSMATMMMKNLLRMEDAAAHTTSMGTLATLQSSIIATYQTLHGKEIRHSFKDIDELSDDDMEKMSIDQLQQLVIDAKSKKSTS